MLERIKVLEDKNKISPEPIVVKINALAFTSDTDFDKYNALSLAQSLVYCTLDTGHKKANYYAAALQEIRARLHKPSRDFKAYFLALFADSDYSKVLESIAKVEKSLRSPIPRTRSRSSQVTFYKCGRQGNYASSCRSRPYSSSNRRNDLGGSKLP